MCGKHDGADSFHRGAMTLLSLTDEALDSSTVATHVKLLKAIPQLGSVSTADAGSAGVCRLPVACPRLDIDKVMRDVPELCFPSGQWRVEQRRLLASLRFRLGLKLTALGPQWLHLRGRNQDMERFLNAFNMSAQPAKDRPRNNRGVVRALVECSALCKTSAQVERAAPGAAELLMGREDIDFSGADDGFFQAGNFQAVVLDNGRVSASLESLLGSYDPDCQVYNRGRDLFTAVLERNDRAVAALAENADGDVCLLSGSPLEASFVWRPCPPESCTPGQPRVWREGVRLPVHQALSDSWGQRLGGGDATTGQSALPSYGLQRLRSQLGGAVPQRLLSRGGVGRS